MESGYRRNKSTVVVDNKSLRYNALQSYPQVVDKKKFHLEYGVI